jgi:hypothetical protein
MEPRVYWFKFTEVSGGFKASILRIQVRFYDCVYMSRCVACNVQLLLDDQFGKCPRARLVVVILPETPPEEVPKIANYPGLDSNQSPRNPRQNL